MKIYSYLLNHDPALSVKSVATFRNEILPPSSGWNFLSNICIHVQKYTVRVLFNETVNCYDYTTPVIRKDGVWNVIGIMLTKNRSTCRKTSHIASVSTPPQIPHKQAWEWTRASTARGRQLWAWVMALPLHGVITHYTTTMNLKLSMWTIAWRSSVYTNLEQHVIGPFTHGEDHKSRYEDASRHQDVIAECANDNVGQCSVCWEGEHEK
jgi:hypothetical protein